MNNMNTNSMYEMCSCGHFGGSSNDDKQQHIAHFQKGHGRCMDCNCQQFTWVGFCDKSGNIKDYGQLK
jgi:hypothetical protein